MNDQTVIESIESGVAIEVFRVAGLDTSPEAREEAFQIAHELGLDKQAAAYKTDESTVPWPVATAAQLAVYRACFRRTVTLENYEHPIPMGVLREVEKARKIKVDDRVFQDFKILCPAEAHKPDPVLIATLAPQGKRWNGKQYIIARWGSSLLPFADLINDAKKSILASITRAKANAERDLAMLDASDPSEWTVAESMWDAAELCVYKSCIN